MSFVCDYYTIYLYESVLFPEKRQKRVQIPGNHIAIEWNESYFSLNYLFKQLNQHVFILYYKFVAVLFTPLEYKTLNK